MHVTIVRLTTDANDWKHHVDEADVFADNPGKFDDGVEECRDDAFDEAVDMMCAALGEAIAGRGTEDADGRKVVWVDVDPAKTDHLFNDPWCRFRDTLARLLDAPMEWFGNGRMDSIMLSLQGAYWFDWMYILNGAGGAVTVSEWLRSLRREEEEAGAHGRYRRFYVHAAYDGNQ